MKVRIEPLPYPYPLDKDIIEAYAEALSAYACGDIAENRCEEKCFCGFIDSLEDYDNPVMSRAEFSEFVDATNMRKKQKDELYRSYVYNWSHEQTMAEAIDLLEEKKTATTERKYEIWQDWQKIKRESNIAAEAILAGT